MRNKTTDDLREELMAEPDLDAYLTENDSIFVSESLTRQLGELVRQHPGSKAALARDSGMSEVYLYQVLSGRRNPSRDRLLCLCIGLRATPDQVQQLLKLATYAQLYPRSRRDAIILHGIIHRTPLGDINDKLFDEGEKTLY